MDRQPNSQSNQVSSAVWYRRSMLILAAFVVVGVGAAWAQDDEVEAEIDVTSVETMTPDEIVAEGNRIVSSAQRFCGQVQQWLSDARGENDIMRQNCLDEKLTRCNANLGAAESRFEAVQNATGEQQRHEMTLLTVSSGRFDEIEQEVSQCVGQEIYETGSTNVTSETADGTPRENNVTPESSSTPPPTPTITPPESPAS